MMPKELNDWLQVIGLFGVLAGLIFVGLQMKQSQEIAVADQYQARADAAIQHYDSQLENESLVSYRAGQFTELIEAREADPDIAEAVDTYGADTVAIAYLRWRSELTFFDNYHFQYERGFLTEGSWLAFRNRLRDFLRPRLHTAFYRWQSAGYRESFRETCFELIAEFDREAGAAERSMLW